MFAPMPPPGESTTTVQLCSLLCHPGSQPLLACAIVPAAASSTVPASCSVAQAGSEQLFCFQVCLPGSAAQSSLFFVVGFFLFGGGGKVASACSARQLHCFDTPVTGNALLTVTLLRSRSAFSLMLGGLHWTGNTGTPAVILSLTFSVFLPTLACFGGECRRLVSLKGMRCIYKYCHHGLSPACTPPGGPSKTLTPSLQENKRSPCTPPHPTTSRSDHSSPSGRDGPKSRSSLPSSGVQSMLQYMP